MINEQTILVRKSGIMVADMDGSIVMMDIETGKYYNLGEVGGVIWDILEVPTSIENLAKKIITEYEVNYEQCLNDIFPFLQRLLGYGLLLEV